MEKIIAIPQERTIEVQRADIERSSRRDIIIYLMEHPEVNVDEARRIAYQKDYDDKYFLFESLKNKIEKDFVIPASEGKANNWSLDYETNQLTITINE